MRWIYRFPKAIVKPVMVMFGQWKLICLAFNEIQENVITKIVDGEGISTTREKNIVTITSTGDSLPSTTGKSRGMALSLVDASLKKDWEFPMSHP